MKLRHFIIWFLCALLGSVFILSAWFKLFPIEPFEYKIVGTTFFGWTASVFVARLVIAIEFGLGLLLLISHKLKETLILTMASLLVFSLHLLAELIIQGNDSDCGCMGGLISFTPLQGLLKNAGMLILSLILFHYAYTFKVKWSHFSYFIFLFSAGFVFIANPIDLNYSEKYLNKPYEGFELNLDTLYAKGDKSKVETPTIELRDKKYILAFVSARCPHCKIAVQKISVIHKLNRQIPFYLFINGDEEDILKFLRQTDSENIAHSKLNGDVFVMMAGLKLPVIYYFDKGRVALQVDYFTLEQKHIEKWLKE